MEEEYSRSRKSGNTEKLLFFLLASILFVFFEEACSCQWCAKCLTSILSGDEGTFFLAKIEHLPASYVCLLTPAKHV